MFSNDVEFGMDYDEELDVFIVVIEEIVWEMDGLWVEWESEWKLVVGIWCLNCVFMDLKGGILVFSLDVVDIEDLEYDGLVLVFIDDIELDLDVDLFDEDVV